MGDEGLSSKQMRFVEEYLTDSNATQAAIRAGYAPKNADVTGPRLLGNVGISAELERRKKEIQEKNKINTERVIQELAKGAFAAIDDKDIKFSDKIKCLELLGRYFNLFSGEVIKEKTNEEEAGKRILAAIERVKAKYAKQDSAAEKPVEVNDAVKL